MVGITWVSYGKVRHFSLVKSAHGLGRGEGQVSRGEGIAGSRWPSDGASGTWLFTAVWYFNAFEKLGAVLSGFETKEYSWLALTLFNLEKGPSCGACGREGFIGLEEDPMLIKGPNFWWVCRGNQQWK